MKTEGLVALSQIQIILIKIKKLGRSWNLKCYTCYINLIIYKLSIQQRCHLAALGKRVIFWTIMRIN